MNLPTGREAALARALVPLLTGNSRTFLLPCIEPTAAGHMEALSHLRLAVSAAAIKVNLLAAVTIGGTLLT